MKMDLSLGIKTSIFVPTVGNGFDTMLLEIWLKARIIGMEAGITLIKTLERWRKA